MEVKVKDSLWSGEGSCCHYGGIIKIEEKKCCGGVTVIRFVDCRAKNLPLNTDACCRHQVCREYKLRKETV